MIGATAQPILARQTERMMNEGDGCGEALEGQNGSLTGTKASSRGRQHPPCGQWSGALGGAPVFVLWFWGREAEEELFILFLVSGVPVFLGGEAGGSGPLPRASPVPYYVASIACEGAGTARIAAHRLWRNAAHSGAGTALGGGEDRRPPPPFPPRSPPSQSRAAGWARTSAGARGAGPACQAEVQRVRVLASERARRGEGREGRERAGPAGGGGVGRALRGAGVVGLTPGRGGRWRGPRSGQGWNGRSGAGGHAAAAGVTRRQV